MADLQQLRRYAIAQSLFTPTTLAAAVRRLGFVQADPIRSPARAQDLILRHRVKGYRAGDLERRYASLNIEEDILYAYGFLTRPVWRLLHPRNTSELPKLHKKVLDVVCRFGRMHPRELEAHFGRERVINAWGGYSKATTRALEGLHHRGLLRIAGRENGIRVYESASSHTNPLPPMERLRKLILVVAGILAPTPQTRLQATVARHKRIVPGLGSMKTVLDDLVHTGELQRERVDGVAYVWPAAKLAADEAPPRVRFLAPFDPLVWDRQRFEHFWRWPYRFEAYTPPARRVRGYYAMPMLWRDGIIGWANASVVAARLKLEIGFVGKRPAERAFRSELEREIAALEDFLNLKHVQQARD